VSGVPEDEDEDEDKEEDDGDDDDNASVRCERVAIDAGCAECPVVVAIVAVVVAAAIIPLSGVPSVWFAPAPSFPVVLPCSHSPAAGGASHDVTTRLDRDSAFLLDVSVALIVPLLFAATRGMLRAIDALATLVPIPVTRIALTLLTLLTLLALAHCVPLP